MNKSELVEAISVESGLTKADSQRALDALLTNVQREVARGRKVTIPGFGSFERRARKARTARNPQTGEAIKVKATKVPAFKAGQTFKDLASGKTKPTAKPRVAKKK